MVDSLRFHVLFRAWVSNCIACAACLSFLETPLFHFCFHPVPFVSCNTPFFGPHGGMTGLRKASSSCGTLPMRSGISTTKISHHHAGVPDLLFRDAGLLLSLSLLLLPLPEREPDVCCCCCGGGGGVASSHSASESSLSKPATIFSK